MTMFVSVGNQNKGFLRGVLRKCVEIPPTSQEGPRRTPGRKCRKSAPRSAFGDPAGRKKCRKTAENVLEMLKKKGRGAFLRHFFGTFSGTPSRVPESTSGSALFRHFFGPELFGAPLAGRRNLKKCVPLFWLCQKSCWVHILGHRCHANECEISSPQIWEFAKGGAKRIVRFWGGGGGNVP